MPKDIKSDSPLPVNSAKAACAYAHFLHLLFLRLPNAERLLQGGYECSEILGGKLKWMHSNSSAIQV
jgi:hypothetical protein